MASQPTNSQSTLPRRGGVKAGGVGMGLSTPTTKVMDGSLNRSSGRKWSGSIGSVQPRPKFSMVPTIALVAANGLAA